MANNYSQLNEQQRETIQILIVKNKTFTDIANAIKVNRTTISRELQRNRYIKSNFYDAFDQKGINEAINKCSKLNKYPYVCNNCSNKNICNKHHLYYNSKEAQKHYEETLYNSRIGVDIQPETIDEIEHSIVPLIKDKKQSVNQVYINHSDILYMAKSTFYRYVNLNVLSLSNFDLPKKVKYKVRKDNKKNEYKRQIALLKGRTYEDYIEFKAKHPRMSIVEMDTVIGKRNENKCLLTLFIKETHFMLIFLLDKKDVKNVNSKIDYLKEKLGIKLYSRVFRIFLTDNGIEFYDPLHFELDYNTGNKVSNLFYCHPYSSWEKNGVEVNHEYIRRVLPKKTSFNNLTDEIVAYLQDNINSIPRESLKGKTPYELMNEKYPEFIKKLDIKYIKPDDVTLNKDDILGGDNK